MVFPFKFRIFLYLLCLDKNFEYFLASNCKTFKQILGGGESYRLRLKRNWPTGDIFLASVYTITHACTPTHSHTHGAGPNRQWVDWSRLTGSSLFTWPRVSLEDPNVKNMWLVFNASGASVNTAAQEHRGQSGLESTSDLWDYFSTGSESVWRSLRPPSHKYCMQNNKHTHAPPYELVRCSRGFEWTGFGCAPNAVCLCYGFAVSLPEIVS